MAQQKNAEDQKHHHWRPAHGSFDNFSVVKLAMRTAVLPLFLLPLESSFPCVEPMVGFVAGGAGQPCHSTRPSWIGMADCPASQLLPTRPHGRGVPNGIDHLWSTNGDVTPQILVTMIGATLTKHGSKSPLHPPA